MTIPEGGFREGDVVRLDDWNFTITDIESGGVLLTGGSRIDPNYCTLLHRPFKVGDEVEVIYNHGIVVTQEIEPQCSVDAWNNDPNESQLRHKKPTWRDHKDWSGE